MNGTDEYSYKGPEFTVTKSQFIRSLSLDHLYHSHHIEVCASSGIHTKLEIPLKQQPVSEETSSIFLGGLYKLPESHYWPPLLDSGFQLSLPFLISCFLNVWLPWRSRWQRRVCRISPLTSYYFPSFSTLSKEECLSRSLKDNVFQHWGHHFKMATLLQRATRSQASPHSIFSVLLVCVWDLFAHIQRVHCMPTPAYLHALGMCV